MLNKELISVQGDEAGTVGSAMLAAVALGQYKNIEDAAKKFVHMAHKYKARKDYTKQYAEQYEKYKKLYNLLKTVR
jgi:xylulokinase